MFIKVKEYDILVEEINSESLLTLTIASSVEHGVLSFVGPLMIVCLTDDRTQTRCCGFLDGCQTSESIFKIKNKENPEIRFVSRKMV